MRLPTTAAAMSTAHTSSQQAALYRYGLVSLGGVTMEQALQRLGGSVDVGPMPASQFVQPQSIQYTLDGELPLLLLLLGIMLVLIILVVVVPLLPCGSIQYTLS